MLVYNVHIKTLKNAPTCFDHHSNHLQGARIFLVKDLIHQLMHFYIQ